MSLSDHNDHDRSQLSAVGADLAQSIAAPFSVLSFWCAIALPVLYLGQLATGIDSTQGLLQFLGLVTLHCLALVGGRSHRR